MKHREPTDVLFLEFQDPQQAYFLLPTIQSLHSFVVYIMSQIFAALSGTNKKYVYALLPRTTSLLVFFLIFFIFSYHCTVVSWLLCLPLFDGNNFCSFDIFFCAPLVQFPFISLLCLLWSF